jgi:hypothetical protein
MFKILMEFVSALACVREYGGEPSGSIEDWEVSDYQNDFQFILVPRVPIHRLLFRQGASLHRTPRALNSTAVLLFSSVVPCDAYRGYRLLPDVLCSLMKQC